MEQIMVLTFKTLHWLLMTAGNSLISNSGRHLSIQQTSRSPYEVAQLKLNCADKQLLKEDTFLLRSFWLSLSVLLPVLSYTNPSQAQLQQSTARRAPLSLSGLFSSFKWVRDAETSFTRQPQAYFSCRTPAEAAAAPCQQLLLHKGSQLLWELPCNNTCKSLSTPQLRGFLLSRNHRTGWGIHADIRRCLMCPICQAMNLLTAIKFTQLFLPPKHFNNTTYRLLSFFHKQHTTVI